MESEAELLQKLEKFCPSFDATQRLAALRRSGNDFTRAMSYLDEFGARSFQQEFQFSYATAREMYAAHAGDKESARKHLHLWQKAERKEQLKKERWLKKDPIDKAKELIKPRSVESYHYFVDMGIVEEGGALWDIAPDRWSALSTNDKKLEWLYTILLLVETDHAQNFWALSDEMQKAAVRDIKDAGWNEIALEIEKAIQLSAINRVNAELEANLARWQAAPLAKAFAQWIIEHANTLSFFTVWQD